MLVHMFSHHTLLTKSIPLLVKTMSTIATKQKRVFCGQNGNAYSSEKFKLLKTRLPLFQFCFYHFLITIHCATILFWCRTVIIFVKLTCILFLSLSLARKKAATIIWFFGNPKLCLYPSPMMIIISLVYNFLLRNSTSLRFKCSLAAMMQKLCLWTFFSLNEFLAVVRLR